MLGQLCGYLIQAPPDMNQGAGEHPIETLGKIFTFHLASKSAQQRMAVGLVLHSWAEGKKVCILVVSVVRYTKFSSRKKQGVLML